MIDLYREITGPLYPILDWPMSTGPNGGYNLCSGIATLGIFGALWHRHNCHQNRCWRMVRNGKLYCKKHDAPHTPGGSVTDPAPRYTARPMDER